MRRPATAIAARGPAMPLRRPHSPVMAATVALLVADHADRVRAIRSVGTCSSR